MTLTEIVARSVASIASGTLLAIGAIESANRWEVLTNETFTKAFLYQLGWAVPWWGLCLYITWFHSPMRD